MSNRLLVNAAQAALLMAVAVCSAHARAASHQDLVIRNVTLISPERASPLTHADVVVRAGKIVEVGSNLKTGAHARRIDGTRRFLIPGLIDSHVHVGHSAALSDDAIEVHPDLWAAYRAQVPRAYLAFGFTSLVDLDLRPSDRGWFESAALRPHLYSCGSGIKIPGGYMAFKVPPPSSASFPNLIYEPQEAQHWPVTLDAAAFTAEHAVARAADAGAVCVKAFVEPGFGRFNWPYLHTETLQRIRDAATSHHLVLMVHATGIAAWQSALDAHADIIAHGLWVWPGDPAGAEPPGAADKVVAAAAQAGTHVQPTLQTVAGELAMLDASLLEDPRLAMSLPAPIIAYLKSPAGLKDGAATLTEYREASPSPGFERLLNVAIQRTRATFKLMLDHGVPIIFGSDTPGVDGFGNPPGLNGRLELQQWADAGVPLSQILRAATLDNANALGLSADIGSIEAGKRADLLLLKANPLKTISAYDSIDTVILNGEPIARASLRAAD